MLADIFVAKGEKWRKRGKEIEMAKLLQQSQQAGTSQGQQHTSTWISALSHSASRQRITSQSDAKGRRGTREKKNLDENTHTQTFIFTST